MTARGTRLRALEGIARDVARSSYVILRADRVWVCHYCGAPEARDMDAASIEHHDGCTWVRARALVAAACERGPS